MTEAPSRAESLPRLLSRLWAHLPTKRKVQLSALFASMLAAAMAEIVSLAAVVPFLTALADPARLWNQPWVRRVAEPLGIRGPLQLVLPLTVVFAIVTIGAALVRLLNLWLFGRITAGTGSDLSQEAYRRTLYQPYSVHVARNSATIMTAIISHVDGLVNSVLNPLLVIAVNGLVIVAIVGALLSIDAGVALLTVATFGGAYLAVSFATKQSLDANGRQQAESSMALVQNVQEGLNAIRDVLLDHSQPYYLARYRDADWVLRQLRAQAVLLGAFPAHVTHAAGMVGVAALAYALVAWRGGLAAALPVLGALAVGAQRLLPALQNAYVSFTQVRSHKAALAIVLDLLDQPAPDVDKPQVTPCGFTKSIFLDGISFRYQPDLPLVLRDVSVEIRRGDRVALVGPTGSGKSTLADILMGLLRPTSGRLLIDGQEVVPEAWQANVAHCPQSIFLADTSIAENIALGIPPNHVDHSRLESAARQAQIADFIATLRNGYATAVGERGVRLSGGQRQRIGIARALYKRAPVLVFDEATSALDDETEKALMDTLDGLSRDLTIVLIAHRLSTTAYCDRVITVANGTLRETTAAHTPITARSTFP